MTSNQIAYASHLEDIRHNQATEANQDTANSEIERHNMATEQLEAHKLQIEQDFKQATVVYQNRMADIQEQYNNTYLALQQAAQDEKERYQQQLNLLDAEKNSITQQYNDNLRDYQTTIADIQSQLADETVRHNAQLETLTSEKQANDLFIAEKQDLYKRYELNTEAQLKMLNLELERARLMEIQRMNNVDVAIKLNDATIRNKAMQNEFLRTANEINKTRVEQQKADSLIWGSATKSVNDFLKNLIEVGR